MDGRPLHIAINAQLVSFAQTYRNAGVSRYTYTLLDGLSAAEAPQRYTAFVASTEAKEAADSPLAASGRIELAASVWTTARPQQRILWEQLALPGELRKRQVDVFHSPVNVLPERLPCASVVTVHDLAFIHYPQFFRPARRVYQRTFTARSARAATLVVAVSESTKRDLAERFGVPEERLRVIYPAIDADFQPERDERRLAAFRAEHGLPESYILFLGTLEPRKNLDMLVEAYARLRTMDENVPQLVIAGAKGWYFQSLFERVQSLGIASHITFAGYISRKDQPLWYAGAGLFVYPSVYEGFGLPIVEALACGTPTITSNVSSMPEAGGAVAMQVAPGDSLGLAHAMRGVLASPEARERTLVEGPRWARRFTAERMAAEYTEVYAAAVSRQPRTRGADAGQGKRGR